VFSLVIGCILRLNGLIDGDYNMTPRECHQFLTQRFGRWQERRRMASNETLAETESPVSTRASEDYAPPLYEEVVQMQNERNSEPPPPYSPPYIISPPNYEQAVN